MYTRLKKTHNFLFQSEDIIIEEHVQLLVGVIDAELFERVGGEVLKAEDVEHAERPRRLPARRRAAVHVTHEPRERARVQRTRHRVTVLAGLNITRSSHQSIYVHITSLVLFISLILLLIN